MLSRDASQRRGIDLAESGAMDVDQRSRIAAEPERPQPISSVLFIDYRRLSSFVNRAVLYPIVRFVSDRISPREMRRAVDRNDHEESGNFESLSLEQKAIKKGPAEMMSSKVTSCLRTAMPP
jgi:hypothetical protein